MRRVHLDRWFSKNNSGRDSSRPDELVIVELEYCLVHITHVGRHSGASGLFFLRLLGHHGLSGKEQRRNGRSVLDGKTGDFGRVDDACLYHVFVFTGLGIESERAFAVLDLLNDYGTFKSGVFRQLACRRF